MMRSSIKRVIVAMSGGVDSSVSAFLLHQRDYDVSGLFMKNWEDDTPDGVCTATEDSRDAMGVCDRLGISLDAVNFCHEYRARVFQSFLEDYRSGRTPNPDVLCNREIKFKAFLEHALREGADAIATGHYAQVFERNGRYHLLKGRDLNKDQSYFLYTLGQKQLKKILFPIGGLTKPQVREIARRSGFDNHAKKDSTGICFIGERNFKQFLGHYLHGRPGEIRTPDNKLIGMHDGLMFYTIGQRKGIGIGGRKDDPGNPWYVVDKDTENNVLIVAQGHDHPLLYSRTLIAKELHWTGGEPPTSPCRCQAKTRYRQPDQHCTLTCLGHDEYKVVFDQPQRAPTPGQSVVFYQGDECIGGGTINLVGGA